MKAKVFLNPAAGLAQGNDIHQKVEGHFRHANWYVDICETHPDTATSDLARQAVAENFDLIVAAGGDGTVMDVINGLVGSEVPLGVIPLGSANVFAAELGIPTNLDAALSVLVERNRVRDVDVGRVEDRYFGLRASVGLEAEVIEVTERDLKNRLGPFAYVIRGLQELSEAHQARYTIETESEHFTIEALTIYVTNGATAGMRPFQLGPDIRMDDGLLDVCIFSTTSLADTAALLSKIVLGDYENDAHAQYLKVRRVRMEADPAQKVQIDGEIAGETPVEIEVVPAALKVLCPPPSWFSEFLVSSEH